MDEIRLYGECASRWLEAALVSMQEKYFRYIVVRLTRVASLCTNELISSIRVCLVDRCFSFTRQHNA